MESSDNSFNNNAPSDNAALNSFLAALAAQQEPHASIQFTAASQTQQFILPTAPPQRVLRSSHLLTSTQPQLAPQLAPQQQQHQQPVKKATSRQAGSKATASRSSAKSAPNRFLPSQVEQLEIMFSRNPSPEKEAMEVLGNFIGLNIDQIRKWFSRRRLKKETQEERFQLGASVTSDESGDLARINDDVNMGDVIAAADRNGSAPTAIDGALSNLIKIEDTTPPPQFSHHSEAFVASTSTVLAVGTPPLAPMTLADINFGDSNYVVKYLKFLAAAETIEEKRARIRADGYQVSNSFYKGLALLKSFKSLIFFRQWVIEAKDAGQTGLLKDVLNLLVKLPITLEGLVASKLGRAVKVVMSGGDRVDEDVKQIAKKLTTAWAALVQKSAGNSAGGENNSTKQPPPKTLAERQRTQREGEDVIATASAAKSHELLANAKKNAT
ncbi:hypothetical protein HK100_001684 [Physocladia obscura]|uniref:Homeobox domain-containing protein n=1 Tax=Physocladia obscura TaxID=109957 RepID=A0AAD5SWU1_9FUNG|nr:hypothetical protein HK100_001684 [Physocladia obscura]